MHTRAVANLLKLFTRRLFCKVVLRFSATGKAENSAESSAPPEAPSASARARRAFSRNAARTATPTNQSNVIRIHTCRGKPPLEERWPQFRPPSRRPTPPPGIIHPTKKTHPLAKSSRLFQRKERRGRIDTRAQRRKRFLRWRGGSAETARTSHQLSKT